MTKFSSTIVDQESGFLNIVIPENIPFILQQGVYAIHAKLQEEKYAGIMYYGSNPTLHDRSVSMQVVLLDTINLVVRPGESIEIEPTKYIREIKEFDVPDDLVIEMQKDEERARIILMK